MRARLQHKIAMDFIRTHEQGVTCAYLGYRRQLIASEHLADWVCVGCKKVGSFGLPRNSLAELVYILSPAGFFPLERDRLKCPARDAGC